MPAPLMHIALAIIALKGPFNNTNKKDFILGTSFPDIRYLKVIDRKQTHVKDIVWNRIDQKQSNFKLGYLFHSWIDNIFDEFIRNNDIPKKLQSKTYSTQSFKFFADKIIYNKMKSSFAEVDCYFDDINKEELSFGIQKEAVMQWHKWILKYCFQGNLYVTAQEFALLPNTTLESIAAAIAQMNKQNDQASKIVDDFYDFACKKITEIKLLNSEQKSNPLLNSHIT